MRRSFIFMMLACLHLRSAAAGRSVLSEEEDMALERKLKVLNKPYVKSFKDKHGIVFDCVDMYKQPAFDHPLLKNHKLQFAQLLVDSVAGSKFQGASALLEVDTVAVPVGQVSSAQILLVDDSFHSSVVNVVQAGWSVDPALQTDSQTRFTTYWTADDYRSTGCLNMQCPGFVVVSQTSTPGMVLPGGIAAISISKDEQTGNWQVFLNQENVGYFPKEIINSMTGATQVQMGGMTYAPAGQKSPPMGNGVAPVTGKTTSASKFAQAKVQGANVAKSRLTKDVSDPAIYNIIVSSVSGPDGNAFQYGGPGGA